MLRSGGVCLEGPAGSLQKVSPRIRALQDRLIDSLPADGAWECLSPAQREAIISLHRARLTRNIISLDELEHSKNKRLNRKNEKGFEKSHKMGFNRYGRSRSYDDKLESETDDSGVRLNSAGTNSTSTTNSQNSHEDDSSDPGIKKAAGRFAKSPSADRLMGRKEGKTVPDFNKRGVTNGIGNVNKIISKQLNRSGNQVSTNVTLDVRNSQHELHRMRINSDSSVFQSIEAYKETVRQLSANKDKRHPGREAISRKNILQRYQDAPIPVKEIKETTSSEEYDSGIHFRNSEEDFSLPKVAKPRRPHSGINYDVDLGIDEARTPLLSRPQRSSDFHIPPSKIELPKKGEGCTLTTKNQPEVPQSSMKSDKEPKINSKFDYRNQINQECFNKYSSNWNSIAINRVVPAKDYNVPVARVSPRHNPRILPGMAPGRSTGNLLYEESKNQRAENMIKPDGREALIAKQEKTNVKKYARSKSLDRKYLDDSSEDESDFEIRRRTERMRRYAKANQELESRKTLERKGEMLRQRYNMYEISHKSKSAWDVSNETSEKPATSFENDKFFRSRKNILNRWKSEESELILSGKLNEKESHRFEINEEKKWRRRSCDFELDDSDHNRFRRTSKPVNEFNRKQWQRRSCDFDLDSDSCERKQFWDSDWEQSLGNEMEIIRQRRKTNPRDELRRMYRESNQPTQKSSPPIRRRPARPVDNEEDEIEIPDNIPALPPGKYQIPPEICGRKWPRIEDHHSSTPNRVLARRDKEKSRSSLDIKGKFRFLKSILSF